jgi:hypothetical protein
MLWLGAQELMACLMEFFTPSFSMTLADGFSSLSFFSTMYGYFVQTRRHYQSTGVNHQCPATGLEREAILLQQIPNRKEEVIRWTKLYS